MEKRPQPADLGTMNAITVGGYKSLTNDARIEIRPLTILAGANSAGKSSIMQPLLLHKQTLESSYDPGTLLLDGPNTRVGAAERLLSRVAGKPVTDTFHVGYEFSGFMSTDVHYQYKPGQGFEISQMRSGRATLRLGPASAEVRQFLGLETPPDAELLVEQNRCFLQVNMRTPTWQAPIILVPPVLSSRVIHLPGLRGNAKHTYPTTAVRQAFPGTFDSYVASVIAKWQAQGDRATLGSLGRQLHLLGLTSRVKARVVSDTEVELQVARMPGRTRGAEEDMVNIADVGVGVSQTLPVLVALLVAQPGQMVYIEQPEIHLHPRAQVALARVLAHAAKRGVRVVAETHSSLLLLGIQTEVANGRLSPELVALHWFSRRPKDGATVVRTGTLDKEGAFGDWPSDFDDVTLKAQMAYLQANPVAESEQDGDQES
jgi:predicted ATPase